MWSNGKRRVKRDYQYQKTKTLERLRQKMTKKFRLDWLRRESEEKFEKAFKKVMNT